jgi:hypothetical protein
MNRIHPEWRQMTKPFTGVDLLTFRALTSWGTFLLLLALSCLAISR